MGRRHTRRHWGAAGLLAPAALFFVACFAYPLVELLRLSFTSNNGPFAPYAELAGSEVYRRVFASTLLLSVEVTVISVVLAYPCAHLLTRLRGVWRNLAFWCVLFPFWVSSLVRTFSWMLLLEQRGPVNQALTFITASRTPLELLFHESGVIIGMTHVLLPYAILPIYASMVRIDRRLMLASESLGASPFTTFRRVFLPLSFPGVGAAAVLVFLMSLGFYITPALLGGPANTSIAMIIEQLVNERLVWPLAGAASVLLVVATFAILGLTARAVPIGRILGAK